MTTDKPPLFIRVHPEVKAAVEKAAAEDQRSVAVFVERLLVDWLREKGYLPPKEPKK